MQTRIKSFGSEEIKQVTEVFSFEDLVDTLISNERISEITLKQYMDLEKLKSSAEKLLVFDIKIYPKKTSNGWTFTVERG